MNYTTLKTSLNDKGLLQVTLSRPEKLNALNSTVLSELSDLIDHASSNHKIRGLLITGEGKAFCAGADINELAATTSITGKQFAIAGQALFRRIETLNKPVVAAINGFTFGGGCELAMACHIRIASELAQFGQPEIKLGVIPGYGGTQRLARLVGKGRALDLCLTGRFIDASTAERWGLVTEVVNSEDLIAHATSRVEALIGMGPLAFQAINDVIDRGYDLPLDDALQLEALHFAYLCGTADKNEGTAAFLAKRPANFSGK